MKHQLKLSLIFLLLIMDTLISYPQKFPTSGDQDIDMIREDLRKTKTNSSNLVLRGFLMKLWAVALQQQGAVLEAYLPVDLGMRQIVFWNTLSQEGKPQEYTPEQMQRLSGLIDEGHRVLEKIQLEVSSISEHKTNSKHNLDTSQKKNIPLSPIPWPKYKGNAQRTGFTGEIGPKEGIEAWKFPIGLAWEAKPVIENGKVYTASPGMRNIFRCLDLKTGRSIWVTKQVIALMGDQWYNTPSIQSGAILLKDVILVRELGSRGNNGQARHVVKINKKTGEILGEMEAGHIDYRAGYAPMAADEQFVIIPYGSQDIEATPPVAQGFNRIKCRSTITGDLMWDFNVGPTFADPVLDINRVFVATRSGYIYCLNANFRAQGPEKQVVWEYKAEGAVNRSVAVDTGNIYFGANDGRLYCLDKYSGKLCWSQQLAEKEPRAFRQFSTPLLYDGKIYVGGADRQLHVIDAISGNIQIQIPADDWIRSRPAIIGNHVFFATLSGTLYAYKIKEKIATKEWSLSMGGHAVFADLTAQDGFIVVNTSDLYTCCITAGGEFVWKRSLLSGFEKEGRRILTEQIAGGGYYQSKPTASNGLVFCGGPSRFVYGLDARTGKERWKFELGAAVSGAPEFEDNKIYIGQQGGETDFYCIDAENGKPIWSQSVGWVWGSACTDNGQVFVPGIDGWAYCLDAKSGVIQWRYQADRSLCTEPFVFENLVYFGSWDHYLYAFDRYSGKLLWKFQLDGGSDSGAPIVANGRIYLPVGGKQFRCLDARTGKVIWQFSLPYTSYNVSPAYYNGRVFIGVQRGLGLGGIQVAPQLYAINSETGEAIWHHPGTGVSGPVVGGDGRIYVASNASPLIYCLAPEGDGKGNPKVFWSYQMGDRVLESVPYLYDNKLFILSCDGYLYAIK